MKAEAILPRQPVKKFFENFRKKNNSAQHLILF